VIAVNLACCAISRLWSQVRERFSIAGRWLISAVRASVNIHVVGQMTDSRAGREAVSEACQGRREVVLGRRVVLI
jgi:hypothetical protein